MDTSQLVDDYAKQVESEEPKVAKAIGQLDDEARATLGEVLMHFDEQRSGTLGDQERAMANRVLTLLHKPTAKSLAALIQIFRYLDVNTNQVLDHGELMLAVDILEMFARADSANQTLSVKELNMLLAVLEDLDGDQSGVLEEAERRKLRDQLWDPEAFLAEQRERNEKLAKLMG